MLIKVVAYCSQEVSMSRFSSSNHSDPNRWRTRPPFLVRTRAVLIQDVGHRSQVVSVSILVRATAMLIQVVAHRSQFVSLSVFVRAQAMPQVTVFILEGLRWRPVRGS
jgi:hypothetical protein